VSRALCLLLLACGGDPKTGPDGADSAPPTDTESPDPGPPASIDGACPQETRVGGFVVEAYPDYSIVDGTVRDGVIPNEVLQFVSAEGDCKLMRRLNAFCDPPCASDEACGNDGACVPFPEGIDVGDVVITGLSAEAAMSAVVPGYRYFLTTLPHPAFAPGAAVRLTSAGGAVAPLLLDGMGVDPLSLEGDTWTVVPGADLTVSWLPPTTVTPAAQVDLSLNIDQHGTSPLFLSCSFVDTGSGVIPAALLSTLIENGVTGFPNGSLERVTADHAAVGEGCVDLRVASPRIPSVRVEGYTPCNEDADCPNDQTCNEALQRCE
jgi:hypothetical protein